MSGPQGGFPRSARLLTGSDYRRVFEAPRRASDALLTVLARRRPLGPARLGLAIAKKQIRRAVDRNRVKRVIRASFREHRAMLDGYDIVVLARPAAARSASARLHVTLRRCWRDLAIAHDSTASLH